MKSISIQPKRPATIISRNLILLLILLTATINATAAIFTVTNTNDSGAGSLRQAISNANAAAGDDIIAFDSSFNVPRTITVGGTLMTITGSGGLTINGPGAALLTVDGNLASRIFEVSGVNSPSIGTITFNNLTITNGLAVSSGDGTGAGIGINNGASAATFVPVVINNVLFRTNFGGANPGGGIGCARSGSVTVNNSVFTRNGANNGGAIYAGTGIGQCSTTITNSSFFENQIDGAGSPQTTISFGGNPGNAIYTISGSSFYNNGNGAGNYTVRMESSATTNTITNTTFANNRNVITAILLGEGACTMTNVTISKNTSSDDSVAAGIILANGAILKMGNSILAGNTSPGGENNIGGAQPSNQFVSQGYNIIGNSFVTPVISGDTTGNQLGVDPLLDTTVRDNGGPTVTLNLRPGSPAIDAGNPATFPATDQRGIARPQDGDGNGTSRSDIGAFEVQGPVGPATFSSVSPARVWDTRFGPGPTGQVGAGEIRNVTVTGIGGVPATGVTAVVLNVTAVNPSAQTFATVWPKGEVRPLAANLNIPPGDVRANLVIVKVGVGGQVSVFNNSGNVDFVADVAGWYGPGAGERYTPVSPSRVWDTRFGPGPTGRLAAGGSRNVTVTGLGGVPATGVTAVVLNVTAVNPSARTFITAWPTGEARPLAANLNAPAGDVRPNLVVVKVGANGQVSFYNNSGDVDLIADVAGYFSSTGSSLNSVSPSRIWDSRFGPGPVGQIGAGGSTNLTVTGVGGVPATGVTAVVLNVTAVQPSAKTFITAWPAGEARPLAANLNAPAGDVRPNLVIVKVGANGQVSFYNNSGNVDLVADVAGWYGPAGQ